MNEIKRGNTAIARKALSVPYKMLLESGAITKEMAIFDYGCGKGFDVKELWNMGFNIHGYDPFNADYSDFIPTIGGYDLLTCNYVLNVIECPTERIKVIQSCLALSDKVIISVRADKKAIKDTWIPYGDGFITPKKTFQRFYTITELQNELTQAFKAYSDHFSMKVLKANSSSIIMEVTKCGN